MTNPRLLDEAIGSIGDTTVPDEVVTVELADRPGLAHEPAELRYLAYVGLYDALAEASVDTGSAAERIEVLSRCLRSVGSVEPVLRFARYEHGSSLEALERISRMRGKDISATEGWLIPRLEDDIAAYGARIAALQQTIEAGSA